MQAIPEGATDPTWVQVMACVAAATTPTPTPTPNADVDKRRRIGPPVSDLRGCQGSGYGPYHVGMDPEYWWYTDADHDGWDCE